MGLFYCEIYKYILKWCINTTFDVRWKSLRSMKFISLWTFEGEVSNSSTFEINYQNHTFFFMINSIISCSIAKLLITWRAKPWRWLTVLQCLRDIISINHAKNVWFYFYYMYKLHLFAKRTLNNVGYLHFIWSHDQMLTYLLQPIREQHLVMWHSNRCD